MRLEEQQQPARTKIDELIASLGRWRGERVAEVRQAIRDAKPEVTQTWKWMGGPVWEQDGIIVVGNVHKVKGRSVQQYGSGL